MKRIRLKPRNYLDRDLHDNIIERNELKNVNFKIKSNISPNAIDVTSKEENIIRLHGFGKLQNLRRFLL